MAYNPATLFANGERGALYEPYDLSTLFQDSSGTTPVTASGQPVGLVLDNSGNVLNASQSGSSKRPTYVDLPKRLTLDKVDDALVIVIPTGGFVGSLVIATDEGTASYGVDIPAGNYEIGGNYFPGNSINGVLLREGEVDATDLAEVEQTFVDNGATASYGGVTNFESYWRERGVITQFPAIDTSSGANFYAAWYILDNLVDFAFINMQSAVNVGSAWRNCFKLVNFPANMFDNCLATSFNNAFINTNLSQSSIDGILVSINSNGTSNGTFDQSGGSAPSATGEAAIDELILRGWSISVTGDYVSISEMSFRQKITGTVPAATNDGQILVINQDNVDASFWAAVSNGGGNILAYADMDGNTRLPLQVLKCDTANSTLTLYSRKPSYTTSDRDIVIMCSNTFTTQPATTASFGRNAVWVDYLYASHNGYSNSTGGTDTYTTSGAPRFDEDGVFLGSAGRLNFHAPELNSGQTLSVMCDVTIESGTSLDILLDVGDNYWTRTGSSSSNDIQFYKNNSGGNTQATTGNYAFSNNTRVSLASTFDQASSMQGYVDGAPNGSSSISGSYKALSDYIRLGHTNLFYKMHFFYICKNVLSASQIASEQSNKTSPSTFWTQSAADDPSAASANAAPTANAGGNKTGIAAGSTVTLDFSGSTDDTGITSYSVTQDTGDVVTLSGTGSSRTYTAPTTGADQTLTFTLTVTDDGGLTGTDTVTHDVLAEVELSLATTGAVTANGSLTASVINNSGAVGSATANGSLIASVTKTISTVNNVTANGVITSSYTKKVNRDVASTARGNIFTIPSKEVSTAGTVSTSTSINATILPFKNTSNVSVSANGNITVDTTTIRSADTLSISGGGTLSTKVLAKIDGREVLSGGGVLSALVSKEAVIQETISSSGNLITSTYTARIVGATVSSGGDITAISVMLTNANIQYISISILSTAENTNFSIGSVA